MSIFTAKIHLYIVAKKTEHLKAISRLVFVFFSDKSYGLYFSQSKPEAIQASCFLLF